MHLNSRIEAVVNVTLTSGRYQRFTHYTNTILLYTRTDLVILDVQSKGSAEGTVVALVLVLGKCARNFLGNKELLSLPGLWNCG